VSATDFRCWLPEPVQQPSVSATGAQDPRRLAAAVAANLQERAGAARRRAPPALIVPRGERHAGSFLDSACRRQARSAGQGWGEP